MRYYDHFVIPFLIGVACLFSVLLYKYVRWFWRMPREDKRLVGRGIFSAATLGAVWETVSESLLHRKIFRTNPLLGYMHMSLAFGWFLLIVVGWIEATMFLNGDFIPLHAHVFFKYFADGGERSATGALFGNLMDLLLLFVLSGVALAWIKRWKSCRLGMKKTTKHVLGDRIALSALWMIFPARLIAESAASGMKGGSSFLTGGIGAWMVDAFGLNAVYVISGISWWVYSIVLAVFLISLPFSRYMHIFTEIPLIFLRRYGVRSGEKEKSFDHFQLEACSRCGICIDPCQLQSVLSIEDVQSVYFIRDRRYNRLNRQTAENCLMCGRCESSCPVGLQLNTLRLNSREKFSDVPADNRYDYIRGIDVSGGTGKTGYFAGCMTHLSPVIIKSMEKIFAAAGEDVWWADRDGGVCCGRPLKLSGEVSASRKMVEHNKQLFTEHGITRLVTSCPICLKVFREEYGLTQIEVLHHSEYMQRLISDGRLMLSTNAVKYTYHDPCELGRGCGIFEEPRYVLNNLGSVVEPYNNRKNAMCCGSSLANVSLDERQQNKIAESMTVELEATGADVIVTACPLCKKTVSRHSSLAVKDLSEVVATSLR